MLKSKKTGRSNLGGAKKPVPRPLKRAAKASAKHEAKTPQASGKRGDTKLATILAMLRQPKGASIEELTKATGWQAHSVRGVISGAIKKKLGLAITSEKIADERRYRVAKG